MDSPQFERLRDDFPAAESALVALYEAGYTTIEEVSAYPPTGPLISSAAFVLGLGGNGRHLSGLVRLAEQTADFEAVRAVARIGGRRASQKLCRWMRTHPNPWLRYYAAYGASVSRGEGTYTSLMAVALDVEEYPEIRGQALEGMAYHLGFIDRRSIRYRRAVPVLRKLLADPAPDVRFWACFAVATGPCPDLETEVRRLVGDQAVATGMWTVGEEAEDALARMHGKPWPDRTAQGKSSPFSWELSAE